MSNIASDLITEFYTTRVGGTRDTAALLSLVAAGVMTTPPLAATVPAAVSGLLAALGSAYFTNRFLAPVTRKRLLPSNVEVLSDHSPHEIKEDDWDGFLIGYTTDTGEAVYVDDVHSMRHMLIIGMTGVGKTVLGMLLMYQQILRGGGLLFVDGKLDSDNLRTLWQYCQLAGRPQDFRVINPGDPENSNTYNPILFGDADEVASRVLSLIPSTENNPGADHYKQEANQGVATIVGALQKADLAYNMIDISILLNNAQALAELERTLAHSEKGKDSDELKNFRLFLDKFRAPDPRTQQATINISKLKDTFGGIAGRLHMFGTGNFGRVMNTYDPDVRLFEAIRERNVIYVALPTMGKNEAANNFGKMILGDLRTAISWIQALPEPERPSPPFLCFLDELGSYATASLARPFEQSRSAKIILCGAIQTLANLEAVSEEFRQMVLGNTWTKIYFKLGEQDTALAAAETIGQRIGILKSLSDTSSDSSSASFLRATPESSNAEATGFSIGERQQEEYLISPDTLKNLDKGEIIMTYGGASVFNLRVPYIQVSDEAAEAFGPVVLTRPLPRQTKQGACFAIDPGRFMQNVAGAVPV
jgi:intracellular multiplication protein IcmO